MGRDEDTAGQVPPDPRALELSLSPLRPHPPPSLHAHCPKWLLLLPLKPKWGALQAWRGLQLQRAWHAGISRECEAQGWGAAGETPGETGGSPGQLQASSGTIRRWPIPGPSQEGWGIRSRTGPRAAVSQSFLEPTVPSPGP